MVLTYTRRSFITLFMVLAMLWAISVSSSASTGEHQFRGFHPPTCTAGCLQSITWE